MNYYPSSAEFSEIETGLMLTPQNPYPCEKRPMLILRGFGLIRQR